MKTHYKKLIKSLRDITSVSISICSGLYLNKKYKLKNEFKTEAENVFGIGVEKIDFSKPKDAVEKINDWVRFHNLL